VSLLASDGAGTEIGTAAVHKQMRCVLGQARLGPHLMWSSQSTRSTHIRYRDPPAPPPPCAWVRALSLSGTGLGAMWSKGKNVPVPTRCSRRYRIQSPATCKDIHRAFSDWEAQMIIDRRLNLLIGDHDGVHQFPSSDRHRLRVLSLRTCTDRGTTGEAETRTVKIWSRRR